MQYYIVWNQNKTLGFITSDYQLAYEARKGSDTNCFNEDGIKCNTAVGFTDDTIEDNCTIETVTHTTTGQNSGIYTIKK